MGNRSTEPQAICFLSCSCSFSATFFFTPIFPLLCLFVCLFTHYFIFFLICLLFRLSLFFAFLRFLDCSPSSFKLYFSRSFLLLVFILPYLLSLSVFLVCHPFTLPSGILLLLPFSSSSSHLPPFAPPPPPPILLPSSHHTFCFRSDEDAGGRDHPGIVLARGLHKEESLPNFDRGLRRGENLGESLILRLERIGWDENAERGDKGGMS